MSADADLKSWAIWVISQQDGGNGWPKKSPMANYGIPSGDSWGSGSDIWRATSNENEGFDTMLRDGLGDGEYNLLKTYYVQHHAQLRKTARFCSIAPSTLKKYLELIWSKVEALQKQNEPLLRALSQVDLLQKQNALLLRLVG